MSSAQENPESAALQVETAKKFLPAIAEEPYVFDGPTGRPRVPQTVALVTMTHNGMEKLPRLLSSVQGFVDKVVIHDTGSTDRTVEWLVSEAHVAYPDLKISVFESSFEDFGTTRTRTMQFARNAADWLLLLDDDMVLRKTVDVTWADIKLSLDPKVLAYNLLHDDPIQYWVPRLVRGDHDWRYVGVTHEYLDGVPDVSKLHGLAIDHFFNHTPEKFERDLRLLTADIARDPDNYRTIFYIANTLRDMGKIEPAIRFYVMRAQMGGWEEEVYIAMYEAARLAEDPKAMSRTFEFRPTRAEPAAWLSAYYQSKGDKGNALVWEDKRSRIPLSTDVLFVNPKCYGQSTAGPKNS